MSADQPDSSIEDEKEHAEAEREPAELDVHPVGVPSIGRLRIAEIEEGLEPSPANELGERYDLNLWIGDPFEGATYLPR